MSKSLDDVVGAYKAQGMISEEDKAMLGLEFDDLYLRAFGEVEDRLLEDVWELAAPIINGYRSQLSPVFIANVVRNVFRDTGKVYGLLYELKEEYIGLRIRGESEDTAFNDAIQPLIDLANEIMHRGTNHPIYSRIKDYLDKALKEPSSFFEPSPKFEYKPKPAKTALAVME